MMFQLLHLYQIYSLYYIYSIHTTSLSLLLFYLFLFNDYESLVAARYLLLKNYYLRSTDTPF